MSDRTSRRACVLWLVALALGITAVIWRTSIWDSVDPSLGPVDARLIAALEQALAPGRLPPTEPSGYEGLEYVVLDPEVDEIEFARRCRSVPGWDAMVVVAPYGRGGSDIDLDAAGIEGVALRRRIRHIDAWMNNGIFIITLIRDGTVVGGFFVSGGGLSRSFSIGMTPAPRR